MQEKNQVPALTLKQRDKELIRWANGFGFCTTELVAKKWQVTTQTASRRMKRLYEHQLFRRVKIFWQGGYLHVPTADALDLIDDELAPLRQISLGTYRHNFSVALIAVEMELAGGRVEPERRIRRAMNEGSRTLGVGGHVPDALLYLPDTELPFAIEVELTAKYKPRLKKIAEFYRTSFDYEGVRYFTDNPRVKTLLQAMYAEDQDVTIESFEYDWDK